MEPDSPPTGTRADLIAAGLRLFGRDGFGATPTRAIAAEARTNVASIAYHFGGKDGLRLACAEEVMRRIGLVIGPESDPPTMAPDQAAMLLETMLRAMVGFVTRAPQGPDTVSFVLREIADQGPALDLLHERFFAARHRQLCRLVALATGRDAGAEDTKLLVFSCIGQAVYFRVGQPLIGRIMGWDGYSEAQSQAIADRLAANLRAVLKAPP